MEIKSFASITPGVRITVRGEDFLVTKSNFNIVEVEGISELVYGKKFSFDLSIEDFDRIAPENITLIKDDSTNYRKSKLFIETTLRNSSHYTESIEIADKAAIRAANYQFEPTLKALQLPKPRILIADAVGLGKTVEVGIFLSELMRRGKGNKILVITPKSILAQFQQEIWSRFAIPLVKLDSEGIARIKTILPTNKNPFDYYDKVIVSIDTLKNNGKFRHYLEKVKWDIVAIDECHNVANSNSQRGSLAKFLSTRCEALILTSATPHNGVKDNFANLMKMLDPTAIPYNGDFTKEDIAPLYVRRFKKDVEKEVGDAFKERKVEKISCKLFDEEEQVLEVINNFKQAAYEEADGDMSFGNLLFSVGLFKAYMSSPKACLETINRRLQKEKDEEEVVELLHDLKKRINKIIENNLDTKFLELKKKFKQDTWKGGKKDPRIIIFAERRDTLNYLEENLKKEFKLSDDAVVQFNGSLTDKQQQDLIEDFSKEDSKIRLFLASDAGSQGVNLHYHCNQMYNYDIPWSIITLDQRNGRIDRFGQTNTPYINYLIAESFNESVQGDIRILERLKEKEDEVHESLGDAGSVWKLFDVAEEVKRTQNAIAKSDISIIEEETEEDDPWDFFGDFDQEETETNSVSFDTGMASFYNTDFAYYTNLINEIVDKDEQWQNKFNIDQEDQIIEINKNQELSLNGVLYDIPVKAFPQKKDVFRLTTDKDIVDKSIEQARKKKDQWPRHQLLYDLHPIARWLQHKLLAKVDKGKALVAKVRNLPVNSAWFVFQGTTSNGKGQPILSKNFVVGKSFIGQSVGNRENFADFIKEFNLFDTLPALEVDDTHLQILQSMLPEAVKSARSLYELQLQGNLEDELEDKLENYQSKIDTWLDNSEKQLQLQFGQEEFKVGTRQERRKKDVEIVHDTMKEFYSEIFQLRNDPFLRVLAVYFNA
jgi:ERCC4-related helicase